MVMAASAQSETMELTPEYVRKILSALDADNHENVRTLLGHLHPADIADLLGLVKRDERHELIGCLPADNLAEILIELDGFARDDIVQELAEQEPETIANAVRALQSDDALYLLEDLNDQARNAVLDFVPEERQSIEAGLLYPEGCAGRIMQREVISVPVSWTVGQVIDFMRSTSNLPKSFYDLFVVDASNRPRGTVALSALLRSQRATMVIDIADRDLDLVDVLTDQEEVAFQFKQYDLTSAPVVDAQGSLIGVIQVDDIMDVIDQEADEDIKRLAGVGDETVADSFLSTARKRLIWLMINLVTAFMAASVIAQFEEQINSLVALAVLMPIVAAVGGNAGTQSLTVAVRALADRSLTQTNAMRVVSREALVGFVNGVLLAALTGGVSFFWFENGLLSGVIAVAMVLNMITAALFGVLVPLILERLGADPAVSSGVFVSTTTDVVGFFAFLGLATVVLL
ncbi:MAG: magnesium transporter [Alphaproteobacteria bacterium]|jgi:magnesium transporter